MALDSNSYTIPQDCYEDGDGDGDSEDEALVVIPHAKPACDAGRVLNNKVPPVVAAAASTIPPAIPPIVAQLDVPPAAIAVATQNPPGCGVGRAAARGCGGRGGRKGRGGGSGRFCAGEGGHPVGRDNYSMSELEYLLESVCRYLPISGAEWDLVAQQHSRFHLELEITGDQLKNKFDKLSSTKAPSGIPNILFSVEEAKAVRVLIVEKTAGATGA
jgi:hypothetical protein